MSWNATTISVGSETRLLAKIDNSYLNYPLMRIAYTSSQRGIYIYDYEKSELLAKISAGTAGSLVIYSKSWYIYLYMESEDENDYVTIESYNYYQGVLRYAW